jgi:uncharacterized RDD family membrane protein YckC
MDFWLIRNGEKTGPLPDYEIRSKIETGDLKPEDPVWSEGMDGWMPLKSVALFTDCCERREVAAAPVAPPSLLPPLPVPPAVYRRFWARWFDLISYGSLWWLGLWATGNDLKAMLLNPWFVVLHLLPWFLLETLLIHHFGTTPGKALLGLSVVNVDGSALSYSQSLRRAIRVMIAGIGFGIGVLSPVCQILNWVTVRWIGMTLWDRSGGHQVRVRPLNPLRVMTLVIGFFLAAQIEGAILSPAVSELMAKDYPEFSGFFDRLKK